MKEKKRKHVGLALQGGGSHGAFTWGVLDRLLEVEEIYAEGICGTSAGAVNAVVTLYGLHTGGPRKAKELLDKLWKNISRYGAFFLEPTLFESSGNMYSSPGYVWFNWLIQHFSPYMFNPFNLNPLKEILLELVDFEELRQMKDRKLFICATNVKTNAAKVFHNEEMSVEAVLASTCLPYLFQAVEIDGEHYWDGGYMGNPPMFPLIEETQINDIVLVKINSLVVEDLPITARDISDRINEISFNSSMINEIKLIQYRNYLVHQGVQLPGKNNKEIFIHAISAYEAVKHLSQSSKLNTNWNFLLKLKQKGREITDQWLSKNWNKLGKASSFDVEKHILRSSLINSRFIS